MKKFTFLIVLMIFLNVFIIFSSIQKVSAKEVVNYQEYSQTNTFTYDINMPLTNNSYANRIAFENFEYETNTNFTLGKRYYNAGFSSVIKDFNDIDVTRTNYTYKSKYMEVKNLNSGLSYYEISHNLINNYDFGEMRLRTILKPNDISAFYIYFITDSSYYELYLDFTNRQLKIYQGSTLLLTKYAFIPIDNTYDYIYLNIEPILGSTNYDNWIQNICYNQSGQIISQNLTQSFDITDINFWKIKNVQFQYKFTAINQKCYLIANDFSFISDRNELYQKAIHNYFYQSDDIFNFYLTYVPFYNKDVFRTNTANKWYYATTNYLNRYLRYKTNATEVTTTNLLTDFYNSLLEDSFSIKMELGTNSSFGINILTFEFDNIQYYFEITKVFLGGVWIQYVVFNETIIPYSGSYDDRVILHAQFKNNLFSIALFMNNSIFAFEKNINAKFQNITKTSFTILNSEIKPLPLESIIKYQNSSNIDIYLDVFTWRSRVRPISMYSEFFSQITINENSITQVKDLNDNIYNIKFSGIIGMRFECERSSENGYFHMYYDLSYIRALFQQTYNLTYEFDHNFLFGLDGGIIYLNAQFFSSTQPQVTITIKTYYTRVMVFSDLAIPTGNLLMDKALDIMIPLLILGVIVIGFKSNSNSKYLAFVGMYIGLFTLYLMEYMSLLFLVLAFIIQTIGLYFIIKHEKSESEL